MQMPKIALDMLIPSDTVRAFIQESGYAFTDWQKASLLYRRDCPQTAVRSALLTVRDGTTDRVLKRQLTEYLEREEDVFRLLKENPDRDFLYILTYRNEDSEDEIRYFFDYEMAFRYGTQTKTTFVIEKHLVGAKKVLDRFEDGIYRDYAVATICYDKRCTAECFDSSELPPADWNAEDEWHTRFEHMFYEVPNPFERGDIVRTVGTDDYGVVETSQSEWHERLARYQSPDREIQPDWSDVQIRVIFPNDDGTFSHEHINPVYLERCQPKTDIEDKLSGALERLLLCVSRLYRGEETLDALCYYQSEYRRAKEAESEDT